MSLELFAKRVPATEAPSIVPAGTHVLVPGRPEDIEKLEKINGKYPLLRVQISGPARSSQEERWFRSLCALIAEGTGNITADVLYFELKVQTDRVKSIIDSPRYGVQAIVKSATEMDHDEYHAFVQLAVDIIFRTYLKDVRRQDVFNEVYERTGLRPPT